MAEVMQVVPKTYDLLLWSLPVLAKFRFWVRLGSGRIDGARAGLWN